MKKSLLIISVFHPLSTGSYGVCKDLAYELSRNGWAVITTSDKEDRFQRLRDIFMTVIKRRNDYQIAQVDVYSDMAFIWAEMSCILMKLLQKKIILTLHGGNLPAFSQQHALRVKNLLNLAHTITAPSEYLKEAMTNFRRDILLVPNPLNIRQYPFLLREEPKPKFVWLRAFHDIYNPELAIKAFSELIINFPQAHLFMIGPDKGDGSYQRTVDLATRLNLNDHIDFIMGVTKSEVPLWLNHGDIFLNTTNIDNTPVSVMEAMACGLCVVSTNVGGIPYLVNNGENGLLVRPNDPVDMANAMRRIIYEPELGSRISQAARNKVTCFDWAHILPMWDQLLSSLIS